MASGSRPRRVRSQAGAQPLKKKAKQRRAVRVQYGALPYRVNGGASLEVLLVTSRQTRRWIIPKGWPIKGLKPAQAAAREAYEEAGVRGRVAGRAIGYYVYEKRLDDHKGSVPCEVKVFPLAVKRQLDEWPESEQRTARWYSATRAAAMVGEKGLRSLILELRAKKGPRRKR